VVSPAIRLATLEIGEAVDLRELQGVETVPDPQISPLSYVAATVVSNDLVFILSQVDELNARPVGHTKVLRWKGGLWGHFMIDWPTTHIEQDRRHGPFHCCPWA
jgi:hypothetical protein